MAHCVPLTRGIPFSDGMALALSLLVGIISVMLWCTLAFKLLINLKMIIKICSVNSNGNIHMNEDRPYAVTALIKPHW